MTDDINTPTSPKNSKRVTDLPYDMTAKSLSSLAAAMQGDDHPAAQLERMNAELLSLLMDEDDQTRLLRRQVQTLDALFHLMVDHGLNLPAKDKNKRADMLNIAAAMKCQRQCFDTIEGLNKMAYRNTMRDFIRSKPPEDLTDRLAQRKNHYRKIVADKADKNDAPCPLDDLSKRNEGLE